VGGGVLRGDAVRFERCDDRPIGTVLDVGDEDLAVPQTRGLAAGDGSRRVGADLLDDGLARGARDRQDRRGRVLAQASRAMRVLAAGEAGALWIEDPADPLAHRVTMRHCALLVTADELDVAAREAAVGTLD